MDGPAWPRARRGKRSRPTFAGDQCSAAEKEQVDGRLAISEMTTRVVDVFEKAYVALQVVVLAVRVQLLEFPLNAPALGLPASQEVDPGPPRVLGELPKRRLPDAARGAHEDCDQPGGETGRDVGVGFANRLDRNHGQCGRPLL